MNEYFKRPSTIAAIVLLVGLAIVNFSGIFDYDSSSSSKQTDSFAGTYTYTDAVNNTYRLTLYSDGDAELRMTSRPHNGLQEIAYERVLQGVRGYWKKEGFMGGDNNIIHFADIYIDGENMMLRDNYIYSSFYAMRERRTDAANYITKQ